MNKKLFSLIFMSCTFSSVIFAVHELRTPLSLNSKLNLTNGSFHYPIKPIDDEKTNIDIWAGGYYRSTCCGYCPKQCDWCPPSSTNNCTSNCNTSFLCPNNTNFVGCTVCNNKKVPLSQLFFGKSAFYGKEAFSPTVSFEGHPELTNLVMNPIIDYRERGIIIGMHMEKKIKCSKWRVGFNLNLPIKNIGVTRHVECEPDLVEITFDLKADVNPDDPLLNQFYEKYEKLRSPRAQDVPTMGTSFMYRLDFLSKLNMPDGATPLVQYGNGSVIIAGREVAANPANFTLNNIATNTIPVMAYKLKNQSTEIDPVAEEWKSRTGSLAVGIFDAAANQIPYDGGIIETEPVNSDGSGDWEGANTPKRWFAQDVDYTALGASEENQKEIFIIPTFSNPASGNNNWYGNNGTDGSNFGIDHTLPIKNIVDYVIRGTMAQNNDGKVEGEINGTITSAQDFFNNHGVYFCNSECATGLGDLDTAIFVGYDFTERSFGEFVAGIRFPTAKKNRCPGRVFYVPTGNNGHFEGRIGLDGGWRSENWFGIQAEVYYTHVFEAIEKRAAQFTGATIRGVGPCAQANVKWGYFVGHLDMTIFHPENQKMGFALGYEIYYKRKDQVCFCTCNGNKALDLLNNMVTLDATLVEANTDILSHKIRGEIYHNWNYFELYAGASKIVGGWNAMSENELHIGCSINF